MRSPFHAGHPKECAGHQSTILQTERAWEKTLGGGDVEPGLPGLVWGKMVTLNLGKGVNVYVE